MRWSPTQYEIEWLDRLQLMISSFVRHTNTNAYSSVNATPYRHTQTQIHALTYTYTITISAIVSQLCHISWRSQMGRRLWILYFRSELFSNYLANSWFLLLGPKIVGRLWTCTIVIISLTVLKCQMSRTCKKTTWQLKWQEIDWRKTLVTCYLVDKLLVGRLKKVRATKHVIHRCDFLGWLWSGFDGTSSDEEECDMTCDVFWRTTWSIDRRFWNTQSGAKIWSCVNVCF